VFAFRLEPTAGLSLTDLLEVNLNPASRHGGKEGRLTEREPDMEPQLIPIEGGSGFRICHQALRIDVPKGSRRLALGHFYLPRVENGDFR
jgi:hypothetical protein